MIWDVRSLARSIGTFGDRIRPWTSVAATLLGVAILLVASVGHADKVSPLVPGGPSVDVPKELIPWVPWVLDDEKGNSCASIATDPVCIWPASVELDVGSDGGRFTLEVTLDADGWTALPGSYDAWPLAVTSDGNAAVVLARDAVPSVWLTRGKHTLVGEFRWTRAPDTLLVPATVAIVRLSVRGQAVDFARRESSGAVWLQAGASADENVPERVEIEVARRFEDGVPLRVTTRLVFRLAGKTRELRLPEPLMTGSRPVSASSDIPLRFEPNGDLVLQVRAGEHSVELVSVLAAAPSELRVPKRPLPWPAQEFWVFVPDNNVRQVELSGAPAVDPAQTNLPNDWKTLQAFALSPEHTLTFKTIRRGEPEPPPSRLMLDRELWLDFDGGGYTVRDKLTGTMRRDWRLDLAAASLGHAVVGGSDRLITRSPRAQKSGPGLTGVELREGAVDLQADWRLERGGRELPAVAWATDVTRLKTRLHLPPGWELLTVSGVDYASDTWLSHWTLWAFFFVLVVALAVAHLVGLPWGLLALAALVLSYDRDGAPVASWVAVLILAGLLRIVPRCRFRSAVRAAWLVSAVVLGTLVTVFVAQEVRVAFFPTTLGTEPISRIGQAFEAPEMAPMAKGAKPGPSGAAADKRYAKEGKVAALRDSRDLGLVEIASSTVPRKPQVVPQDPDAVVQTGPGVPTWDWRTVLLDWSGPVQNNQAMTLWFLSPWWTGLLGCLRAALVAVLAFVLVRATPYGEDPPPKRTRARKLGALVAGALFALFVSSPAMARADIPDKQTLDSLRARLVRGPDCDPCIEVASLELGIQKNELRLSAEVHAGALTAYQLPGPARSWVPSAVRVDGQPSAAMVLGKDGFLHVRVGPGRHRVEASGPVAGSDLTLAPGSKPRYVTVIASAWTVDGVRDGHAESSLHFSRTLDDSGPGQNAKPSEAGADAVATLPPWLKVQRTFALSVNWRVHTVVERVSPPGQPLSLRYPLLAGEEVTEPGVLVEDRTLVISLDREQTRVSYTSIIKPRPELAFVAAVDRPWTEEWRIACGTTYRCRFEGLAPVAQLDAGTYAPRFLPWPGEKLTTSIVKPEAAAGESRTMDAAALKLTPGQRLTAGELRLELRATKGGTQALTLPPGAVVQSLTIDGVSQPIRMAGRRLELALAPGKPSVEVTWHEPGGIDALFRTPGVSIGGKIVNSAVQVVLPRDRWLLFTHGPSWGPKVLLWAYALLLLAAATVLSKLPQNPLKRWQWWLLGLGLTQVPIVVALTTASWFFAMALRGSYDIGRRRLKSGVQLFLPLWTLVFLACLVGTVYNGLVNNPDMLVRGGASDATMQLQWYADRVTDVLPTATVLSAPLWVWRILNLVWALWLAVSLLGWLRWAWGEYSRYGLWRVTAPHPSEARELDTDEAASSVPPAGAAE